MTNITETSDIFSGHYEIQIILFLTLIVVTMHTTYHFGTILELHGQCIWDQFVIAQEELK